ncbi:hypothetical protein ACT691_04490 [Vibrio metschnikovii]
MEFAEYAEVPKNVADATHC